MTRPCRSPAGLAWFFCVLVLVSGCASGLRGVGNGPLTRRALERRLALGAFDSEVVAPRGREAELVELARELGLRGEAVRAAERNLQRARAGLAVLELGAVADRRDASKQLDDAVELAISVGRWAGDADLVLTAALLGSRPERHRRAMRWAARRRPNELPATELAPAWAAVGDDASGWLGLFLVTPLEDRSPLDEAMLDLLGQRGLSLRQIELANAIARGDLATADRHARAIAKLDPGDYDARIYLLGRAEAKRGSIPDSAALWADDFDGFALGSSARARLRQEAHPRSEALALARAATLFDLGLTGDAAQVLADASVVATAEGREVARLLWARIRMLAGDPEPYRAWVKSVRVEVSVAGDSAVAELDVEGWSGAVRAAAREARRRLVDEDIDLEPETYAATLLDRDAPRRTRVRAEQALVERFPDVASLVLACRDAERELDPCRELVHIAWESDMVAGLLERYGDSPRLDEYWVRLATRADPDTLRRLAPTIAKLDTTRVAITPAFVEIAVRSELARGRVDAAQTRLDRFGLVLDDETLTFLTLAIVDARSGAVDRDRLLQAGASLPGLDPLYVPAVDMSGSPFATERLAELGARGGGVVAEAERGATLYRFGAVAKAAEVWEALAGRVSGRARATLRSRAALAKLATGGTPTLDGIAVDGAAHHLLAAIAGSADHWAPALRLRPSAAAYRGLFGARVDARADPGPLLASARSWIPRDDGDALGSAQRALRRGELSDAATFMRRASWAWSPEVAWALGRAGADDELIVQDALEHVVALVDEASSRDAANELARQAIAYIEATLEPLDHRELHIDFLFLLGRADAGLAVAQRTGPDRSYAPLLDDDFRVLLLRARKSGQIDDARAWALWRWIQLGEDSAEVETTLTSPPASGPLLTFACQQLVAYDRLDEALPICQRAVAVDDAPWGDAVNLAYVLLNREPVDHATLGKLFDGKRRPPRFDPAATLAPPGNNAAHWYQNRAVWLSTREEVEASADAWLQAYALGIAGFEALSPDEAHLLHRGEVVRHRELAQHDGDDPATLGARLGYQALVSGSWVAARIYARKVLASTKDEVDTRPARTFADEVLDVARLAEGDIAQLRIPPDRLALAVSEVFDEGRLEARVKLQREHDRSAVASLSLLQEYARHDDMKRAAPIADALLASHADVPLVVTSALPVLLSRGQHERARRLFADLAAEHRGRPSVRWAALPESVTGPHPGVPAWVRDPKRFDARLAAVSDDELAALVPRWRSHTEVAADGFFPIAQEPREGDPLGAADRFGGWTRIGISARASRCEAEVCAEPLLDALRGEGLTVLWTRQVELPAGTATDAMVSDGMRLWSIAVLPAGGRVFELSASAPTEHFAEFLPTVLLLREGFAPLDRVLPSFRAASLRASGAKLDSAVRLAARREFGRRDRKATGCPVANTLATLPYASTRAEVLLDLMLYATDRRRVLACAKPTSPDARRIALVALLDEDAAVHAYGRTAVRYHGTRVLRDVRDVLSGPLEPPLSAPDLLTREDLPPRGLVEVALALPPVRGRELVQNLLASTDERERAMGWVAATLREGLVDDATVESTIRTGKPLLAMLAVDVSDARNSQHIAALRSRLDGLDTIADSETMWLALSIAHSVAAEVAREDSKRLRRLAKLVGSAVPRAKNVRESFTEIAEQHTRALALAADDSKATSDDAGALELLQARRYRPDARPHRSVAALRRTPLADLLPGDDWAFARVASPGLFASTVNDLSRRLDPPDRTQRLVVDPIIESIKTSSGFASLLEGGGLDLGKPIECATPAGSEGFVCSATVADRNALLTVLGQRPHGSDAGVAIPLHLSTTAGVVPLMLSGAPAFLHPFVYEDPSDDESASDPVFASERLRVEQHIAAVDVSYYAIVHQYANRLSTDSERYLFIGDRLFVFSSPTLAWRVLLEPPSDALSLSRQPEFARLTQGWKDGAALQAVAMGVASPLPKADVSIEVVVDGSGLSFRYAATAEADVHDIRPVDALLPKGAVTRFAAGVGDLDELDEDVKLDGYELLPSDVLPPLPILRQADALAFGWYPAVGDSLWKRWIAVVQRNPGVDKAAQRAGLRGNGAEPTRAKSGIHFATRDGMLVLGSDATLLGEALRGASVDKGERADVVLARGAFAGAAAAAVIAELPHTADLEPGTLRFGAAMIGLVDDVAYEASWNPTSKLGVLEGRLRLRLAEGGDSTEVVDQWLAAARMRNAGRLPRNLGDDELEGTLVYTLEVADAKAFARQTVHDSARAKAVVIDDTHVRLTIAAKPRKDAQPLGDAKRKKLLDSTTALRSDDARIVKLSRTLVPAGTAPDAAAKKILEWVHGRIAYEVTPRSLDGVEILEAGRGDCSEYARLTVSLLRAAGVPAEVRDGMAAQGDEMVAHAWVGYHDGERWHEIDPTWGRMSVTAGHLPVSVVDILALLSLDGLRITKIDAKP